MALLDVRHLTVEYHTKAGVFRAVEDLSFQLDPCKSLGLVGESGCGKTTAMLALMRLLPDVGRIVEGEVILDGIDLLQLSPTEIRQYRWAQIAMVFQGAMNALNPVRSVGSQIKEAMLLHKIVGNDQADIEVKRLLELVGVPAERQNQYPHQYSGGMRQRAMIAMALACKPKVLITDEPTTALDVMVQAQILDLLNDLQNEFDLAVIMVTHDLGVVSEVCDDVLVMYGGRLAEYADAERIFTHPVHPYTSRLLQAFPDIDDPRSELSSIPGHPPALDNLPPGCRFEPRCGVATEECARSIPGFITVVPGHICSCLLASTEKGAAHE